MSEQENNQHVGGPVPDELFQPLNLYSIAKDVRKTEILRNCIAGWLTNENIDISELIKEISLICENEWVRKKAKDPILDQEDFEEHIRVWENLLKEKRVSESIIKKIISSVDI